jgi:hypothetical protein
MPTKAARARKWLCSGKAKPLRTKLNVFAVQLTNEPGGREKQDIVVGIDPGSKFTGIVAASKKATLYGINLELPDNVSGRMDKRRECRRNRRNRKVQTKTM